MFRRSIEELSTAMQERGGIDLQETFIDGSFVPTQKGAMRSEGQNAAKGTGSWQLRMLPAFLSLSACCSICPLQFKTAQYFSFYI